MKRLTLLLSLTLALAACKTDGDKVEDTQGNTATAQQAETTGAAAKEEQPESAPTEVDEVETFWSAAKSADKLVVTDTNQNPVLGGKPVEITDAAWLTKFHAAIGDGPGSEAVPKCLPTYLLTYYKGDTEVAKMSAVCANADTAMFVQGGQSFAAEKDAEVLTMLKGLQPESE